MNKSIYEVVRTKYGGGNGILSHYTFSPRGRLRGSSTFLVLNYPRLQKTCLDY